MRNLRQRRLKAILKRPEKRRNIFTNLIFFFFCLVSKQLTSKPYSFSRSWDLNIDVCLLMISKSFICFFIFVKMCPDGARIIFLLLWLQSSVLNCEEFIISIFLLPDISFLSPSLSNLLSSSFLSLKLTITFLKYDYFKKKSTLF